MALTRIEATAIVGAIGTNQLTDGAVTSPKIADSTITTQKLQLSDDWGLVTGSITATDDFGALV